MINFIFVFTFILLCYISCKYFDTKNELSFYKCRYRELTKEYLKLHNEIYESVCVMEDNGYMTVSRKVKEKYKKQ